MRTSQIMTTVLKKMTISILVLTIALSAHAKENIVLGLTGTVFKDDLKNFMDWEKYLENKNDFDVKILFSKTYAEMNALIKEGKVDVAYVCNSSYTKLHKEKSGKLLAIPIVEESDKYYSYIITKKSMKAESILDLKGKLFAFTDPDSNSGSIAPKYFLLNKGIDTKTFFKSYIYTYAHGESIKAVVDGFVDGASVDSIVYSRFGQKYKDEIKKVKIIQVLGPFTNSPIVVRSNLPKKLFLALQESFSTMHLDAYGKTILEKLSLTRFDIPSGQDFTNVAKMVEVIENQ